MPNRQFRTPKPQFPLVAFRNPQLVNSERLETCDPGADADEGGCGLTEEALEAKNREDAEQNQKLNMCVRTALKQLDGQTAVMEERAYQLGQCGFEGRQERLRKLSVEELEEKIQAAKVMRETVKTMLFRQQGAEFTEQKVEGLRKAGCLLTECKDVMADATKLCKSQSTAASTASQAG